MFLFNFLGLYLIIIWLFDLFRNTDEPLDLGQEHHLNITNNAETPQIKLHQKHFLFYKRRREGGGNNHNCTGRN